MWKATTKSPTPTSPFAPIPAQPTDLKKVEVAAAKKRFAESPAGEELAKLIFVGASREKNLRKKGRPLPKLDFFRCWNRAFHISLRRIYTNTTKSGTKKKISYRRVLRDEGPRLKVWFFYNNFQTAAATPFVLFSFSFFPESHKSKWPEVEVFGTGCKQVLLLTWWLGVNQVINTQLLVRPPKHFSPVGSKIHTDFFFQQIFNRFSSHFVQFVTIVPTLSFSFS